MFTSFIHYAAPKHRLILGRTLLAPAIVRYKYFNLAASDIRPKIASFAFKGISKVDLEQKGEYFSRNVIPRFLIDQAKQRLEWHKLRGDTIVIVSASLSIYLRPWCNSNGYELLSSELEFINGAASGCYAVPDCSSNEKVARIKSEYDLSFFDSIFAYGDTPEDHAMLSIADSKVYKWKNL